MTTDTRCVACKGEMLAIDLALAATDGFLICLTCVKARHKAVVNGGRCTCRKAQKRPV